MRVILCKDYDEVSLRASEIVKFQLMKKPDSVLGLPTGSTPIGMYIKLVEMNKSGEVDFSKVTTFNIDEYYPISNKSPQSYHSFMDEHFFSQVNINPAKAHILNGEAVDPGIECERYDAKIREEGGIDLQILGIGHNGHIGFNEPDAKLKANTHITNLSETTRLANARFFDSREQVPQKALTMGMSAIMNAKSIVLIASGKDKSRVVAEMLNNKISTSVPATLLKTHKDIILICDQDAYNLSNSAESSARLGVDIGGTNIKFAVVDKGHIKCEECIDTAKSAEKIVEDIANVAIGLSRRFGIKTMGVGVPGIMKDGCISASNLAFKNFPLGEELEKATGLVVTVENDANCAALGEMEFGDSVNCDNIVLITLGTGVGGGVVMNRSLVHGRYSSGELGHMVIETTNGRECPCGLKGCWEQYASVTALVRDSVQAAKENPDSILYSIYQREGRLSGRLVFEALDKGCPVMAKVFDRYLDYLATGINSILYIFGPDVIVLSGGISKEGEKITGPLRKKIKDNTPVVISSLQNSAGAMGAAML